MRLKFSLTEIFIFQLVLWLGLWLLNDYLATLLTLTMGAIVFAVLLLALMAEWIERSKVPRRYFQIMGMSLLAMLLAAGIAVVIAGGRLDFLQK